MQPCDIALELLQQGLAKILEGSANRLDPRTKEKLRAAERQAKASRIRMWQSYVAPPSSLAAMNLSDKEFSGKVVEVVSGDTVVVSDIETGNLCFASFFSLEKHQVSYIPLGTVALAQAEGEPLQY